MDDDVKEFLNRSIHELENTTTTQLQDEYELVTHLTNLPERKNFPRGKPITAEQWKALQDHEGRVEDIESIKLVIFRGVRFNPFWLWCCLIIITLGCDTVYQT